MAEFGLPVPGFSFYLKIDDNFEAAFAGCSGLSARREVTPQQEGGVNDYVHQLPGRVTYSNITLKRGITFSNELWEWFEEGAEEGGVGYRTVLIYHCVPYSDKVARVYDLGRVYPIAWSGPDLDANSTQIAIESLELAVTRIRVTQGTASSPEAPERATQ
ncbi:MAG: phage tail protein [Caldilineaceae bacterium]